MGASGELTSSNTLPKEETPPSMRQATTGAQVRSRLGGTPAALDAVEHAARDWAREHPEDRADHLGELLDLWEEEGGPEEELARARVQDQAEVVNWEGVSVDASAGLAVLNAADRSASVRSLLS